MGEQIVLFHSCWYFLFLAYLYYRAGDDRFIAKIRTPCQALLVFILTKDP